MTTPDSGQLNTTGPEGVGLPDAPEHTEEKLRDAGIDPDRLSMSYLGIPAGAGQILPEPWIRYLLAGFALWVLTYLLRVFGLEISTWAQASLSLLVGLVILQGACSALITVSERLAARLEWDHYIAGTTTEILSTLPELVVIGFLIPVSPLTAFVIALISIYNNALVFSIYSYFLPKDKFGKHLMPQPITGAGTQILVAGAAIGLILGLVMMLMSFSAHEKQSFVPGDLILLGLLMLAIFGVYISKVLHDYAEEEGQVSYTLSFTDAQEEERRALVYTHVQDSSWLLISGILLLGILGAVLGGEQIAHFAHIAIRDMQLNPLLAALVLAGFAGMSEYLILWQSHRKGEFGIALANSFGGITQVMFLILPFTLISIGCYQAWINPDHPELPLLFSFTKILLLIFLFPMLFVLIELLEEDHTLDLLDTIIMVSIFLLLIILLLSYGQMPL
jgi:sodium/calcium exchanger protein